MKEGYEDIEPEVKLILASEAVKSVEIGGVEDFPQTIITLENHVITITSLGGHGGIGIQYFKIESIEEAQ